MPELSQLHFLRPWWLVAVVPSLLLWFMVHRQTADGGE